jgi:hypothetical protein
MIFDILRYQAMSELIDTTRKHHKNKQSHPIIYSYA